MNRNQSANHRQYAPAHRVFLLVAGIGSLCLVTAQQVAADAVAENAALEQALFGGQAVEMLGDARLAGIRGKYVEHSVELKDAVILWDERPAGTGQGGGGNQNGNSAQGAANHQVTRVTAKRSQ